MKKFLTVIILILLTYLACPMVSYAGEPFDTVTGYLEALKSGDTLVLKSHIGGRLYQNRKVLLEDNAQYSEFLRKFYEGSRFRILAVVTDEKNQINKFVDVEFQFQGGNKSLISFVVTKDPFGVWKIVDEIEGSR